jgi:hypothetical protein
VTTIVYDAREKVMVCDSCWSDSTGRIVTEQKKILRFPDGALYGAAGDSDDRKLVDMITAAGGGFPSSAQLRALKADIQALFVSVDGRVWLLNTGKEDYGVTPIEREFCAIGSGANFAIGALRSGKTAREAVEIACLDDIYSRPPVWEIWLDSVS